VAGQRTPQIAVPHTLSRWSPSSVFADVARALEASGVVDQMMTWDQLVYFWPPQVWTDQTTGMKGMIGDLDSHRDVFATSAYGLSAAPKLGLTVSTDAIRRGPAELFQTMTTLAEMTEGEAIIQMGAGEYKQCKPYGWKRSRGLARLEDHLKLAGIIYDNQEPVSFEGNDWTFDHAWLGAARPPRRPQLWGLGGGPKLLDLVTSYADGFCTSTPNVWASPEGTAENVAALKDDLERKERDPEGFGFGTWVMLLVHDDPNVIDRALENPIFKWLAATAGRMNQTAWDREGIEPVMPRDWHYAMRMLPIAYSDAEVEEILGKVTREMTEKSYIFGTAAEVTAEMQRHVDAGLTWIAPCDLLPMIGDPADVPAAMQRTLDVCALLKGGDPTGSGSVAAASAQ
jgi:phthiodiolone/phenolphthiodiolone dimycocerosates ketoreductase